MLPLEIDTKKRNKFSVFRPVEKESKALKPNPKTNLIKTNFDASSSSLRSARGNKTSVHVKTKMMKQNHSLLLPPPCWRRCPNLNTRILIDFIPSRENENLDYHDELSFKATSFKTPTFVRWFRAFGSARVEWSELNQSIKTLFFFFFAFQLWPTTNHKVYEDPYSKHTHSQQPQQHSLARQTQTLSHLSRNATQASSHQRTRFFSKRASGSACCCCSTRSSLISLCPHSLHIELWWWMVWP